MQKLIDFSVISGEQSVYETKKIIPCVIHQNSKTIKNTFNQKEYKS